MLRHITVEVGQLTTSSEWLIATARQLTRALPTDPELPQARAGDWLIEIEASGAVPLGRHVETVSFRTDLPREPTIEVKIIAFIRGAIELSRRYIVLPVALVLALIAVCLFVWAVRSGQMDDLETPGLRMLHDDEEPRRVRSEEDEAS